MSVTFLHSSFLRSPSGFRRYALAYALGLLAALAFPPFNAVPVLWVSFPLLVWLLRGDSPLDGVIPAKAGIQAASPAAWGSHFWNRLFQRKGQLDSGLRRNDAKEMGGTNAKEKAADDVKERRRKGLRAFLTGWSFAFGLLTVSLYWIAGSLFVDIKAFWWVLPFAVAGLPAFLSIYYGLAAWAATRFGMNGLRGVLFFAVCWFGAEMARGHLLTGFPWDILGYVWGDCLPVLQITSVIGIEGLTFLTILLAVSPSVFFVMANKKKAALSFAAGVALLAALAGWGWSRLQNAQVAMVPGVRLRLIQPDIDQALKWRADQRLANFEKLLALSFNASGEKPITHYIWPETATAYYLTEEPEVRSAIAARMPQGSVLLTGVVRRAMAPDQELWRYYNSLIAMDSKGSVLAGYDKHHLVPFGEFMPLRSVVPFRLISMLGTDFSSGPGPRTIRAPNLPPFSALVCYEAIFSGEVVEKEDEPQFLLNVTNDAWYRGTIGPAQHFVISRVRAIEEGMPLVRAANRGVTGVVDSYGRIVASVGEADAAFVDADLPQPIGAATPFECFGLKPLGLITLGIVFVLFSSRMKLVRHEEGKKP